MSAEVLKRSRIGMNKPLILFLEDSNTHIERLKLCFGNEPSEQDSPGMSVEDLINPELCCESTSDLFAMINVARSFGSHYARGREFKIWWAESPSKKIRKMSIDIIK